ncbi:MAG TPA: calcium-binding protein [Rhodothermales bacterium]|nr:calcium-binding protein [Rhodothermales bacterium]
MEEAKEDPEREDRIYMEAIVDCYGPEEQAMGWYSYLADRLGFPFKAHCIEERTISPLRQGEKVKVKGMAPEDDCMCEMFVMATWKGRSLGVPLAQLEPVAVDEQTEEAIGDWHYWVGRGNQLC